MKILIKPRFRTFIYLYLLLANISLFVQAQDFIFSVKNLEQTAANKIEFDVYLLNTDSAYTMELASCQLGFLFNSSISSGGTLSAAIDNSGSGLNLLQQFTATPKIDLLLSGYPGLNQLKIAGRQTPGTGNGTIISTSGDGTLLTHFIITNTTDFSSGSSLDLSINLSSVDNPIYATAIAVYDNNQNIQLDVYSQNTFVDGNLILNPPPAEFNVTGSGSYCSGEPGLEVGLDGSELFVTYTLYKNNVPQSPTIQGTGSAISFGNQLAGTYTIIGSLSGVDVEMTGSAVIVENPVPTAPVISAVNQPDCYIATGSVNLTGLPSGDWTLSYGTVEIAGSGVSTTLTSLNPGSYSFVVTSLGCKSPPSDNVIILAQPPTPEIPVIDAIIQPTCNVSTGRVRFSNLPAEGTWEIRSTSAHYSLVGSGEEDSIINILPGSYRFIVINEHGCISDSTDQITINPQPQTPSAPQIGTITPPDCSVPTGSVELRGLPSGNWVLKRFPGGIPTDGTGSSVVISGLSPGNYNFTVTNQDGCESSYSANVNIPTQPVTPLPPVIGLITHPTCTIATGSVQLNGLPGGRWLIVSDPFTQEYRGDASSTIIEDLPPGSYRFIVVNEDGCKSDLSDEVVINSQPPTPDAPRIGTIIQPTCDLPTGSVSLSGLPSGLWDLTRLPDNVVINGSGQNRVVDNIPAGSYTFTVTNSYGCTSEESGSFDIDPQPPSPPAPVHDVDCSLGYGNAIVKITSPIGPQYTYSLDGNLYQSDPVFTGVANGSHSIRVMNQYGCVTTGAGFDVSCGCVNPPVVILSRTEGLICSTDFIQIDGNTFGGSATRVSLSSDGAGNLSPLSINVSPFSFRYVPAPADAGRVVTITVTTDNPVGFPCTPAIATFRLRVNATPAAPQIGNIIHPTCTSSSGSVYLTGLPAGSWGISIYPGPLTLLGSGPTTTISGLAPGDYYLKITSNGCTSVDSTIFVIDDQPPTPDIPLVDTIIQPTCAVSTGSVRLSGLPEGTWTITRTPGNVITDGSGSSVTIGNIPTGNYTFTVTNSYGCVSGPTSTVRINPQPVTPTPPVVGERTHPTCTVPTGSVQLSGLPSGDWTLTQYPDETSIPGSGSSRIISGLLPGTYFYTVTNADGCTSGVSASVVIDPQPPTPTAPVIGNIIHPSCTVGTGRVVLNGLPSGNWKLIRYPGGITIDGSGSSITIMDLEAGRYRFEVINEHGCISPRSEIAEINPQPPTPDAPLIGTITQPSCTVPTGSVILRGLPAGNWVITRIPGNVTYEGSGNSRTINDLVPGVYTFTVTNSAGCISVSSDPVEIDLPPPVPDVPTVQSIIHPTCTESTGSITLIGLPADGEWTLIRNPGSVSISGSGTSFTVTGLASGDYTFRVRNSYGCLSAPTSFITVNQQPQTPSAPIIGIITPPTCNVGTGSVVITGLPATGRWTLIREPDNIVSSGTGPSTTVSNITPGRYRFRVINEDGCISEPSSNVIIPLQPQTPSAPLIGSITPPGCNQTTGSVRLTGLPAQGQWTLTRYPGIVSIQGSGTETTISGLLTGTYNFTVTNSDGCTSDYSDDIQIPLPPPIPMIPIIGNITHPGCEISTGSVELLGLPASEEWIIAIRPGQDSIKGEGSRYTVTGLEPGRYTFTVTNSAGCTSNASATVNINSQPPTPNPPVIGEIINPGCTLPTGSVTLRGLPASGEWIVRATPGNITRSGNGTSTIISDLDPETYTFTVTNSYGCTSLPSEPATINPQPPSPAVPVHSVDCSQGYGNAVITVSSPVGAGIQYQLDSGAYQSSPMFTGVANGDHRISVRNSFGCITSGPSFSVNCGCVNPPVIVLSSSSGNTCGLNPITVSDNRFSGSATRVTLSHNGSGTLSPSSVNSSPFEFSYRPSSSDIGKVINITLTTDNPLGFPCTPVSVIYRLTVVPNPGAPLIGPRTHPSCTVPTGSVILNGLPSTGTWILLQNPGGVEITGSGTSTTVTDLLPGSYTFAITNAAGCSSGPSARVVINDQPQIPAAPVIDSIVQTGCFTSTGSVTLSGLPETGTWTLTRHPDMASYSGNGTSVTLTGIPSGTYTYTVRNSDGCTSEYSEEFRINPQPLTPPAPSVGVITPPSCTVATGSVVLRGLPSYGEWTLTRFPGGVEISGSGTSITVTDLPSGSYNFTVTNSDGCSSQPSDNVRIPAQPPTPSAPVIGTITQPSYDVPTGSVILRGLPAGDWVLTRYPGNVTTSSSGSSILVDRLPAGVFTFTVTNNYGCTSDLSEEVIISTPGIPDLYITDPDPVCTPSTVDITVPEITEGSTPGLIYTYWLDEEATIVFEHPDSAERGIYYIKGTTVAGFFNIKPVIVTVYDPPVAFAGPDQILDFVFSTTMNARLEAHESGTWTSLTGNPVISDINDPNTLVSNLLSGDNFFSWTVSNGVCENSEDIVKIEVGPMTIPTLITPNYDGKNDFFVLKGLETLGKTEIRIFDRRGLQVYINSDYKNDWDGVDYNNNPLPEDTYFYIINPTNGESMSGYIVIRR